MAARVLRAPLLLKLLGANLVIVAAGLVEHAVLPETPLAVRMPAVLAASFLATAVLVWIALRPIAGLESTAQRVSAGDFAARAPVSPIADAGVARLSDTFNRLLDRVQSDRARIEYLAGRSVRARDVERESVARELRESLAQMLSAVSLGIANARRINNDTNVDRQLEATRQVVQDLTEQVRGVAEALYPGTITQFGLPNVLQTLGRVMSRRSGCVVEIDATSFAGPLSALEAAALYRVADEALRNVVQHAHARRANVSLTSSDSEVRLEVEDDGRGVDVVASDPLQGGLGLFSARTVLALAGGELQISGAPGRGTRVVARLPRTTRTTPAWPATLSA